MLGAIEQRPMNNEFVNLWISKLSPAVTLAGILNFTANFYQRCKQKTTRSTIKYFAFPLSGKNNYVVEKFRAKRERAIISWDHYLTTLGEAGSGDSLPILHRTHPTPHLV